MMDKENITSRSAACPSPGITEPQKDKVAIFLSPCLVRYQLSSCHSDSRLRSTDVTFDIAANAQAQPFLSSESSRSNGSRDFALHR